MLTRCFLGVASTIWSCRYKALATCGIIGAVAKRTMLDVGDDVTKYLPMLLTVLLMMLLAAVQCFRYQVFNLLLWSLPSCA